MPYAYFQEDWGVGNSQAWNFTIEQQLASDWLLRHGQAQAGDMDEAERRRVDFHLRQFVDAMSPTLLLASIRRKH